MSDKPGIYAETTYGFRWGPIEVERFASVEGGMVLEVKTAYHRLEIYASKTGRRVRVFDEKGREWKPVEKGTEVSGPADKTPVPTQRGTMAGAPTMKDGASVRLGIGSVVKQLQEILGTRLVGYLSGSKDPKAVTEWAEGVRSPRDAAERRLRAALQAVEILLANESEHVVRAWFIGQNPQLEDEAPAAALVEDRLKEVIRAARSFTRQLMSDLPNITESDEGD